MKQRFHRGLQPKVFHFREVSGTEVDLLVQDGMEILLVEAKSGQTMVSGFLDPLRQVLEPLREAQPGTRVLPVVLYGGDQRQKRQEFRVLPWNGIEELSPGKD